MKRITWITSGYMLQVDLPILYKLKDVFDISWIVYDSPKSDKGKTAQEYASKYNIKLDFYTIRHHRYSPFTYWEYTRQMKLIRKNGSDIYYFNIIAFPYLLFAIKKYLPPQKIIMAMHHGKIHRGMQLRHIYKYYLSYLCKQKFSFQYYSQTQANFFTGNKSHCFIIPLALNDFGSSDVRPPKDYVQFLYFGNIIPTKNIGLLIKAACKLKERTDIPFKIKIVGHCRNWSRLYQPMIQYPEIFDLHIQSVPNEEIPDLFSSSHFLVLPYKSVTQSGPLRIAYGYNLPVIASDLPGFKESIIDNITGLFFKSDDIDSLYVLLLNILQSYPNSYIKIRNSQREYVDKNMATDVIFDLYVKMFNSIKS